MRVLVTRPLVDAERTARELKLRGHEAVVAPVLGIVRTDNLPPKESYAALVLTSANAVAALPCLGAGAKALPVFTVGERTAAAATEAGCRDVRVADGDAASLASLVARTAAPGITLLHVAARDRKPEPEAALAATGFVVLTWVAYEAVRVAHLPEAALAHLRDRGLDAALHYSRRSASVAIGLVAKARLTSEFCALTHVCLSADTAAPLQAAGARQVIIAARPDERALLIALDARAEKSDGAGSRGRRSG